jgi:hypothetical protein
MLQQAQDFFSAGTERGFESARPLALYYSYMNLVKSLCLTRGGQLLLTRRNTGYLNNLPRAAKNLLMHF